jgi:hypothetical protein
MGFEEINFSMDERRRITNLACTVNGLCEEF